MKTAEEILSGKGRVRLKSTMAGIGETVYVKWEHVLEAMEEYALQFKSTDSVGEQKTKLNLEALKRIAYHFAGAVAVGYDFNSHRSFEYEWNKWLETGKIKEWGQHESTSKEIVTTNQLINTHP